MSKFKENKLIKIGILGSGFGAIHTALELSKLRKKLPSEFKIHVTIISNVDYFWLVTMAHEIATGNLLPNDVMQPLRSLPVAVFDDFIQANVKEVNTLQKSVKFELIETVERQLSPNQELQFDYLISAIGAQVNYFGIEGAEEFSLPIKTLDDVKKIKNQILQSFEDAERLDDAVKISKLLSFVIVGGGATGLEVAGELADMVNGVLLQRFPKVSKYTSIIVIHGGKKVGIPGSDWMTPILEAALSQKGCVKLLCSSFVSKVTPDGVWIDGQFLPAGTVIWSGGVVASPVKFLGSDPAQEVVVRDKAGRIAVSLDLSLKDSSEIFVIGDQASLIDPSSKQPYPMRAQFAVRQAKVVANNIVADFKQLRRQDFRYKDKGVIVGLGDGSALAEIYGYRFNGRLAYLFYKIIYIPQIIGLRAKVRTLSSWFLNLFTPRDLSKI